MPVSFFCGDPEASGAFLGVAYLSRSLFPGQYEDIAIEWSAPFEGPVTVFAFADRSESGESVLDEFDETNNSTSGLFMVGNHNPNLQPVLLEVPAVIVDPLDLSAAGATVVRIVK